MRLKTTDLEEMLQIMLQRYQIQFLPLPKEIWFQSLRRYHIYKAIWKKVISTLPVYAVLIFALIEHSVKQEQDPAVSLHK